MQLDDDFSIIDSGKELVLVFNGYFFGPYPNTADFLLYLVEYLQDGENKEQAAKKLNDIIVKFKQERKPSWFD